jgi:hypothetical protein
MLHRFQDVDARDKRGHDESRVLRIGIIGALIFVRIGRLRP